MTGAVLDRPRSLFEPGDAKAPRLNGGVTLEDRLNASLHAVRANGSTECPMCHARMTPSREGVREEATCDGCGTRLS